MESKLQARQKICVVICLALLATALYSGCTQQSNQNAPSSASRPTPPTALPSPSPSASLLPDDTIIVIKGDSIDIDYGTGYVAQPSPTPDESLYRCAGCKLQEVEVSDRIAKPNICPVTTRNATITLDGGGARKNISVVETATGVDLSFNNVEYKHSGCPAGVKNCNPTNKIKGVKINSTDCSGCPANGKCDVTIRSRKESATR
jgi:hypothetical protein